MNVGVDFGSTYTTVSMYKKAENRVEAMEVDGSTNIPSVACINSGKMRFGKLAKEKVGKKSTTAYFEAFKMLLPEQNKTLLHKRGYTDENSPYSVTAGFLDSCLHLAMKTNSAEKIDNLVICAPEVWSAAVNTADGRPKLRDICNSFPYVNKGHVKVISEPAAASAFFAHNYDKNTGRKYNGHILLIDYGGGTLDITLTEALGGATGSMEIKIRERCGAGENEEGQIGKAGIAYMEGVTKAAICAAKLAANENAIPVDEKLFEAVNSLESELRSRVSDVDSFFEDVDLDEPDEYEDEEFCTIEYDREELPVSYGLLVNTYNKLIKPVLNSKIQHMTEFMEKNSINYRDVSSDNFKIALVGGFGNYYLVRHQVNKIFRFNSKDNRFKDIIKNSSDRERAISYGAALIASGEISIRSTAPYSIGIFAVDSEGRPTTNYAIEMRQEIEYGKPYFQKDIRGEKMPFFVPNGSIDKLIINTSSDIRGTMKMPLKENLRTLLKNSVTGKYKTANVAFSLDQSEVLSMHIEEYDYIEGSTGATKTFELSRFSDLFETSEVVYIVDDLKKTRSGKR